MNSNCHHTSHRLLLRCTVVKKTTTKSSKKKENQFVWFSSQLFSLRSFKFSFFKVSKQPFPCLLVTLVQRFRSKTCLGVTFTVPKPFPIPFAQDLPQKNRASFDNSNRFHIVTQYTPIPLNIPTSSQQHLYSF